MTPDPTMQVQTFARDFGACVAEGAIIGKFRHPVRRVETVSYTHLFYIVLDILIQFYLFTQLIETAINLHSHVTAALCLFQKLCVRPLPSSYHRSQ